MDQRDLVERAGRGDHDAFADLAGGSIARLDRPKPKRLAAIPGQPPSLLRLAPGCAFADRCAHRFDLCDEPPPLLARVDGNHLDACHLEPKQKKELRETTIHPELIENAE